MRLPRPTVTVFVVSLALTSVVRAAPSDPERLAGVSADVDAALAEAKAALSAGQPREAAELLIRLYATDEPFTVESRRARQPAAAALLRACAEALADGSELEQAARASDAAWALDPVTQGAPHADLLVAHAREVRGSAPEEALFLVRRARLASPDHAEAASLDEAWSRNPLEYVGWGIGVASVVGLTAGLGAWVAGRSLYDEMKAGPRPGAEVEPDVILLQALGWTALVGTVGGAIGVYVAGGVWMLGAPEGPPTSPATLPALPGTLQGVE